MAAAKTRVHILTGFLGSGKTTLLNRLLASGAFDDTAVVVNELGEIGLDHLLVSERTDQIALLEGGCLCCAVVDSLPETLLELCRKRASRDVPAFARIVIETTGLADPGPIVDVIRKSALLAHFLEPGVVITALDMLDSARVIEQHPEAASQVVLADRIVLTKLDLRGPLEEVERTMLSGINPFAEIVTSGEIMAEASRLIAPLPPVERPRQTETHAHHSLGIQAYGFPVPETVTHAGLAAFARVLEHRLGDALLRCKGFVRTAGGAVLIQGVGNRFSFTDARDLPATAPPHVTCIVQNGRREDVAGLIQWLHVPEGTLPPSAEEIS